MTSILPPNATPSEIAIEQALADLCDLPVTIADLWSPERCPAPYLPWLAWALSVDDWDASWPAERQREVIAASIVVHRHKGTIGAIRRALAGAGYGDARVIEGFGARLYDGSLAHDGAVTHATSDHWAEYRLVLERPITLAQAGSVRTILENVAPLRCHLKVLDFTAVATTHDGSIVHDGTYTYGEA